MHSCTRIIDDAIFDVKIYDRDLLTIKEDTGLREELRILRRLKNKADCSHIIRWVDEEHFLLVNLAVWLTSWKRRITITWSKSLCQVVVFSTGKAVYKRHSWYHVIGFAFRIAKKDLYTEDSARCIILSLIQAVQVWYWMSMCLCADCYVGLSLQWYCPPKYQTRKFASGHSWRRFEVLL